MIPADDNLATTFEPLPCMECMGGGLTADQCATILHAEQMTALAVAEHDIAAAETVADAVQPMHAKADARRRLERLARVQRLSTRVAIVDPAGFPLTVLDRTSRVFQHHVHKGHVVETERPDVWEVCADAARG